jgi:hypothetical protein
MLKCLILKVFYLYQCDVFYNFEGLIAILGVKKFFANNLKWHFGLKSVFFANELG